MFQEPNLDAPLNKECQYVSLLQATFLFFVYYSNKSSLFSSLPLKHDIEQRKNLQHPAIKKAALQVTQRRKAAHTTNDLISLSDISFATTSTPSAPPLTTLCAAAGKSFSRQILAQRPYLIVMGKEAHSIAIG
jgi:hypothetical protein